MILGKWTAYFKTWFLKEKNVSTKKYYWFPILTYLCFWLFANSARREKRKEAVELHFKNSQCQLHCYYIEASGRFFDGSLRSAFCAFEEYIHNHFRLLPAKSVGSFPLISVYVQNFEKQDNCLTLDLPVSFRCVISCPSLIYETSTAMSIPVTVRSNLIIWSTHSCKSCSHLNFQARALLSQGWQAFSRHLLTLGAKGHHQSVQKCMISNKHSYLTWEMLPVGFSYVL